MKQRNFKLNETTLFVYKSVKVSNGKSISDPTTTMVTTTAKTTGFNSYKK
ncbi:hypothetical protein [Pedobacter metabolipauper]|uniref:Uncharacterized protein n=1 Tax=Pedobacter metabolipauper TaxID=425513 RepID=A0A4R6SQQ1_9SPHI|nr:hypothetical protein [Pedobacter metabolipauper]TDQ06479.1 hypothetical protein ATK78_4549 [Pedobacter metabolipauper]